MRQLSAVFLGIGWIMSILIVFDLPTPGLATQNVQQASGNITDDSLTESILYYVNLHRKSLGLPALQLDPFESSVAAQHSKNMATGKTAFGHDGAESRAKAISNQLGSIQAFGENVAFGQESARDLVDKWLQSKPHRENIEGDFTRTGIGWAKDKKGVNYFTELFTK
jgi:uncharacterized protein YkwD